MFLLSADQRGLVSLAGSRVRRRGSTLSEIEIEQPQIRAPLVGVHVRFLHREGDVAPIRGQLRIGDAVQTHQVIDAEGFLVGGRGRMNHEAAEQSGDHEEPVHVYLAVHQANWRAIVSACALSA